MLPWMLYQLTPRDQGSPLIRPFFRFQTVTAPAAAFAVFNNVIVPDDFVLLVTSIFMSAKTTVAANWNGNLELRDAQANARCVWTPRGELTALSFNFTYEWRGSPFLMANPGDKFHASVLAPGTAGNIEGHIAYTGFLVPRGTMSLT